MISTIVIGSAYNNMQLARSVFTMVTGNRILSGDGGHIIDFLGDKVSHSISSLQDYGIMFYFKLNICETPKGWSNKE